MKKVISILAALAVLFACNPVEPNTPDKPDDKPEEKPDLLNPFYPNTNIAISFKTWSKN